LALAARGFVAARFDATPRLRAAADLGFAVAAPSGFSAAGCAAGMGLAGVSVATVGSSSQRQE
jgi:hypothetical protein